jgi:hypothetical protein
MFRKSCHLLFVMAVALSLPGCGVRKGEVETEVKKGIEEKLHVKIKSINLNQGTGDTYTGTAETTTGDVYEVTATVKGRMIEWKAQVNQAGVEKELRKVLEDHYHSPVQSISLTKGAGGNYTGEATLNNGTKLRVTVNWEGALLKWEAVPLGAAPPGGKGK